MKCPACNSSLLPGATCCSECNLDLSGASQEGLPPDTRPGGGCHRVGAPSGQDGCAVSDGTRAPGIAYTCPVTGLEFVNIPGGQFQMGDLWGEGDWSERPVHWVAVAPFQMATTVVTQEAWERVMGSNPAEEFGSNYVGANKPVVGVSWYGAYAFARILNQQVPDGHYRLPSEAEWEYAARSGGKRYRWAGTNKEQELADYAWYWDNRNFRTYPVAQKRPNELGLFDMAGNVWEWCQDTDNSDYEGAPTDGSAWIITERLPLRVRRGGSWFAEPDWLRSVFRNGSSGICQDMFTGFRVVRDIRRTQGSESNHPKPLNQRDIALI